VALARGVLDQPRVAGTEDLRAAVPAADLEPAGEEMTNCRRGAGCQSRNRPVGQTLNEICVVASPLSQSVVVSMSTGSMCDWPSGPV
jgi:hypothetical protein